MWNEYFNVTFSILGMIMIGSVFVGILWIISHFGYGLMFYILESKLPKFWSYILSIIVGLIMLYLFIMVIVAPLYLLYMYGPL